MSGGAKLKVRLAEVVQVNALIKRFRFVRVDGAPLPAFSGGAHIVVEMDDNGTRRLNPYSLMSSPADRGGYEISVRRDDVGRGGSLYLHNEAKPGMEMEISYPVNLFALDSRARKHLMIAGGIGITPVRSLLEEMGSGVTVLYRAVRDEDVVFRDELDRIAAANGATVHYLVGDHNDPAYAGLLSADNLRALIPNLEASDIYVCGPPGMADATAATLRSIGAPRRNVHIERFAL